MDAAQSASAFGLLTRPVFSSEEFVKGGRAWQRLWLQATQMGYSVHPLIAPLYLFPRVLHGGKEALSHSAVKKLETLRERFAKLWDQPAMSDQAEVFLFRIFKTDHQPVSSIRLSTDKIFIS
ncbi:MAG: hypothetical protein U5L96_02630 [Owenweeksia sp.]|nr:hypothetical protein [Owenweeksia sp.]